MGRFVASKNQENESQMTPLMKAIKSIHSVSSSGDSLLLEDIKKQRAGQDLYAKISTPIVGVDTNEFSVRAWSILRYYNINTLGELVSLRKRDIMAMRNLGKVTMNELEDYISKFGYQFK